MDRERIIELSSEQLTEIELFAGAFMGLKEIAHIFGIPPKKFRKAVKKDLRLGAAVRKGRLEAKYKVRAAVLALAAQGSPQAVAIAADYMEEIELQEALENYEKGTD